MRTEDIHPVSEHRTHLTEHLRQVQETGRPIIITQKGRAAGVLLSPTEYDKLVRHEQLNEDVAAIREGLKEIAEAKGIDAREAIRQIAAKHGLTLES